MKEKDDAGKLRGSYTTPYPLVKFLVDWAIKSKQDMILEPSSGEGVFLETSYRKLSSLNATTVMLIKQVTGVEIDATDCDKARQCLKSTIASLEREADKQVLKDRKLVQEQEIVKTMPINFRIFNEDFFRFYNRSIGKQFDVVLGNPPFIRYQNWDKNQRELAFKIMKGADLKTNRLTNAWVAFVVASSLMLSPNGRLAMVIPAELLQVKFAAQLRLFLSKYFNSITILTFKKLVFPSIQQEVVLLLAERNAQNSHGINVIELDDTSSLQNLEMDKLKINLKPIEHTEDKWIQYFLTSEEILLLRKLRIKSGLKKIGEIAEVDVGIVTGENDFFLVNKSIVQEFELTNYVVPLVGRTTHVKGLIFKSSDWDEVRSKNLKSYLLALPEKPSTSFKPGLVKYLQQGEKDGINEGYKCSIRKYWYSVPSVWVSDAFLTRQINMHPRLVSNEAKSMVTDTIHRVKFKDRIDPKTAIVCFHNSLTFAFSEVMGRSYGGGVLELEPNEAEQLPIPYYKTKISINEIDDLFRVNKVKEALDMIDSLTLKAQLGLSEEQIKMLRGIWEKLSIRRKGRKAKKLDN